MSRDIKDDINLEKNSKYKDIDRNTSISDLEHMIKSNSSLKNDFKINEILKDLKNFKLD
jgi:hypothetical protein